MSSLTNIQAALSLQGIALAAQTAAIKSIVTDLDGIKGQLDQAISSGADSAELQAIADQISRNTAQLNASTDAINSAILHDVQHADLAGSAPAPSAGTATTTTTTTTTAETAGTDTQVAQPATGEAAASAEGAAPTSTDAAPSTQTGATS